MKLSTILLFACLSAAANAQANTNSMVNYIVNGEIVKPWKMSIGNALNWSIPVADGRAETAKGNLVVSPSEDEEGAMHLKWRGKVVKNQWGGNTLNQSFVTLNGNKIDLSTIVDNAAIAFQVKKLRNPSKDVALTMRCKNSNKCEEKFAIKHILKRLPSDEWKMLTVPLNCFAKGGDFDYSQITDIFKIATEGKLDMLIKNVGLISLPTGSKGCAK